MQLIDIGVNLTNKRLRNNTGAILSESARAGVTQMVVTGTSIEHSQLAIELCQQYPQQLVCTAGVHPHDASDWTDHSHAELTRMVQHTRVRAIGETGLDFNRMFSPREQQIEVFVQHLELAVAHNKPVFLHQRDAFDSFDDILSQFRDHLSGAVVHCFTDSRSALHRLLDLDCHIGITGWICDERRGVELQGMVKDIPVHRLMLETDAPFLLPRDLRPRPANNTNLPQYLPHILRTVARLRGEDGEQLADDVLQTTRNFFAL